MGALGVSTRPLKDRLEVGSVSDLLCGCEVEGGAGDAAPEDLIIGIVGEVVLYESVVVRQ